LNYTARERHCLSCNVAGVGTQFASFLFFSGMAVLILASVSVGFARSYYLAGVFEASLPNLLVHIHGVVFSC